MLEVFVPEQPTRIELCAEAIWSRLEKWGSLRQMSPVLGATNTQSDGLANIAIFHLRQCGRGFGLAHCQYLIPAASPDPATLRHQGLWLLRVLIVYPHPVEGA